MPLTEIVKFKLWWKQFVGFKLLRVAFLGIIKYGRKQQTSGISSRNNIFYWIIFTFIISISFLGYDDCVRWKENSQIIFIPHTDGNNKTCIQYSEFLTHYSHPTIQTWEGLLVITFYRNWWYITLGRMRQELAQMP